MAKSAILGEGWVIRPVRHGDGAALDAVFRAAVQTLGSPAYNEAQLAAWVSGITPHRLEARTLAMISFAAMQGDRLVGFASMELPDAPNGPAELDFLYVHPDVAGRGLGWRLLRAIETEAGRHGIERLELTSSLNAVEIYRRYGFARLFDMEKTIQQVSVPCVRMAKSLTGNR